MPDRERIEFDYAWDWFQYHASQRLTAFNFFLVIVGFLLVGYAQAVDHRWSYFGGGLGIFGALVALAFFVLDVRNEELVLRGRDALAKLEGSMDFSLADPDDERSTLPEAIARKREPGKRSKWVAPKVAGLVKHKVWLRLIIFFAGVGFTLAAIWSFCGYQGSGSDPVACRESTVLVLHRPGLDLNLVSRSEHEGTHAGSGDESGRTSERISDKRRTWSAGGGEGKLVGTGRHCAAEPAGGDRPQP